MLRQLWTTPTSRPASSPTAGRRTRLRVPDPARFRAALTARKAKWTVSYLRAVDAGLLVLVFHIDVALIQAAVWILRIRSWRRRSNRFLAEFRARPAASGERFIAGLERAVYRGGTGPYSAVKGNGTIILTDRRLVFRRLSGGLVEVPAQMIGGIRQSKTFRGSRVGGATHLVVATTDSAEVGFFVKDIAAWERALDSSRPT